MELTNIDDPFWDFFSVNGSREAQEEHYIKRKLKRKKIQIMQR